MVSIRTRIRVLRAEREWSQATLATQVRVTRQTINSIERGKFHPNLRLAFTIARAFGKQIVDPNLGRQYEWRVQLWEMNPHFHKNNTGTDAVLRCLSGEVPPAEEDPNQGRLPFDNLSGQKLFSYVFAYWDELRLLSSRILRDYPISSR